MSNNPPINLQEKRDIGQVLNTTFAFIRLTYKYLYKDLLFIAGPFFILSGLFSALEQVNRLTGSIWLPLSLSLLCSAIGWTISYSIVANYVLQYKIKGTTDFDVQEIRKNAWKDFFKLLFVFILFYLAVFFGMILLIIPGMYFAVAYGLAAIDAVLDKESGISDTFKESRRLIKDNWWRTLGLSIIVIIIIYVLTLAFSLPTLIYSVLVRLHSMSGDAENYRLPLIIFTCFSRLAYCMAAPISIVSLAVYYYSLKEEKDQLGLLQKIDELGKKENDITLNEGVQ